MATFIGDGIDKACEGIHGHTNWAYWSTLSEDEKTKALANKANVVVVFYDEDVCSECGEVNSECGCAYCLDCGSEKIECLEAEICEGGGDDV